MADRNICSWLHMFYSVNKYVIKNVHLLVHIMVYFFICRMIKPFQIITMCVNPVDWPLPTPGR